MFSFKCGLLALKHELGATTQDRQRLEGKSNDVFTDQPQTRSRMGPLSTWESSSPFDCFQERNHIKHT
jgi:hypothetical protein